MSGKRAQRAPLLSSVVMVLLATAATGLLVVIGFQGLPQTVVPSTFYGDDHETRHVDVTGTPFVRPTPRATTGRPSSVPAVAPPSSTRGPAWGRSYAPGRNRDAVRPVPKAPKPTVTAPPKTTAPAPKASPTPTRTSTAPAPAPSPTPTCTKRGPDRCPKSAPTRGPSDSSDPSYSESSESRTYSASSYSGSAKTTSKSGATRQPARTTSGKKTR
ncbi:MAG TPA: hypothetical protein VNA20_09315 [Frankiaceae bacterium]|nr:hypothetical protein [Frankiaceae bacterium]